MNNGLIFFEILTTTNPDLQPYLTIFNFFFSLLFSAGIAAMVMGWVFRVLSRS